MYTADELEIRCALAGSPRADELIACLEGEIAKRDAELAACRVAVENCELFRARIAELEARIVWLECEAQVNAAPVSEAQAQGVVIDADDLAQFIREIDGNHKMGAGVLAEHIAEHIADSLNAAPVSEAQAQGVVMPDTEDFCFCGKHVSLQMISGGASNHGYLGSVTLLIDGEYVEYTRLYAAPAAPAADAGLVDALEMIVNPIEAMRRELQEGEQLNGMVAMQLASDPEYLRGVAKAALAAHRAKGVV